MGREFYFMNKFISKIAVALVGCAMAVGVGVAIGNNSDFKRAEASGTDNISLDLSSTATNTWANGNINTSTSGAHYSYKFMGTKNTSDGRIATTNGNGGIWSTTTGGIINSVTVVTTAAKTLAIYLDNSAFTSATDTSNKVYNDSQATAGSNSTFTYTWSGLSSHNCTHVFLKGTESSTAIKSISFVWNEPPSDPTITVSKANVYLTTITSEAIDVSYAHLKGNISVTQSSENDGAVSLSKDNETFTSSLELLKTVESPQTIYVKGTSIGTVNLSFESTDATTRNCTVEISAPRQFQKITKAAEIKNGGHFVIAYSTTPSIVMSTTQATNNRPETTAKLVNNKIVLPNTTSVDVLTIEKGTGDYSDYYSIYDSANEGYLYGVSGNNYLKNSNPATKTNYYYWSISFNNSGDAVIKCKGNDYVIRYNSGDSGKLFSTYNGSQQAVSLYELTTDVPAITYLSSITASNSSVGEGSTVNYVASYLPVNATVDISAVSSNNSVLIVNSVSATNGTLTISLTGGSVASDTSATLTISGASSESTTCSTIVTITVTDYTATHTLVTDKATLSNGSKVIIGCTVEEYNYSAVAHSGGNTINGVATAFANDKSTLASAPTSKEYILWCIDDVNGYYVLSDGGYFLCSPTAKSNYLLRTDTLNARCYFTLTNDANGVIVKNSYGVDNGWEAVENPYVLGFNYSNSYFTLYGSTGPYVGAASLYKSNGSVDTIQGFIDAFMHFGNVSKETTSDTNACRNSEEGAKGYYVAAKAAFNSMSDDDRDEFYVYSGVGQKYHDAYERLSWWATANGEELDVSGEHAILKATSNGGIQTIINDGNNSTVIAIVIISTVSALAVGGYFFIRRRKER